MLMLFAPMMILYEVSIWLVQLVAVRRRRPDLCALADQEYAERRIVPDAVTDHVQVPGFEDPKRQRPSREQDGIERKQGNLHGAALIRPHSKYRGESDILGKCDDSRSTLTRCLGDSSGRYEPRIRCSTAVRVCLAPPNPPLLMNTIWSPDRTRPDISVTSVS